MAPRQHRLVAEDGRFVEIVLGVTRLIGVELKKTFFDEQEGHYENYWVTSNQCLYPR